MLHEAVSVPELVDRESAHEFLKEATRLAASEDLVRIGAALASKSDLFREHLLARRIEQLTEDTWRQVTDRMFFFRRNQRRLPHGRNFDRLKQEITDLLHGSAPIRERFNAFVDARDTLKPSLRYALASELLHYAQPERYCLWTHWIWDPATGGGALPLVLQENVDLAGADPGETYDRVSAALAGLQKAGEQEGLMYLGRAPFGITVFLACVYAVYMYTVVRMRLSKEFNQLLPELTEFSQRLLGVHEHRRRDSHV